MARKRSTAERSAPSKPKQLRKRLRKAEDQLADAVSKRDRAQARVEALSIIADEIRAQLAEAEKTVEQAAAEEASKAKPATTAKGSAVASQPAVAKPASSGTRPNASEPRRRAAAKGQAVAKGRTSRASRVKAAQPTTADEEGPEGGTSSPAQPLEPLPETRGSP